MLAFWNYECDYKTSALPPKIESDVKTNKNLAEILLYPSVTRGFMLFLCVFQTAKKTHRWTACNQQIKLFSPSFPVFEN